MSPPEDFPSLLKRLDNLGLQVSEVADSISSDLNKVDEGMGVLAKRLGEEFWIAISKPDAEACGTAEMELGVCKLEKEWGLGVRYGYKGHQIQCFLKAAPLKMRLYSAKLIPLLVEAFIEHSEKRLSTLSRAAEQMSALATTFGTIVTSLNENHG